LPLYYPQFQAARPALPCTLYEKNGELDRGEQGQRQDEQVDRDAAEQGEGGDPEVQVGVDVARASPVPRWPPAEWAVIG